MKIEPKINEIQCKSAIGKCGFPGGGFAINPYVGCGHNCAYCYARFIKRFTKHNEKWGSFVDARVNIAEVLEKQLKSPTYNSGHIYIGTVTDPYQEIEEKYKLTRSVLKVLAGKANSISILSKSDLVLRDIDLLKQFKSVDVNITINTLDEEWKRLIEPDSPPIKRRFDAIKKLNDEGISTCVMMGPYWPFFTDADALFKKFKDAGVKHVFSESLNTTGGNWIDVEHVLEKHYPQLLKKMQDIMFNKNNFHVFYNNERKRIMKLSEQYKIPSTVYFGLGHAAKSVQNSTTAK